MIVRPRCYTIKRLGMIRRGHESPEGCVETEPSDPLVETMQTTLLRPRRGLEETAKRQDEYPPKVLSIKQSPHVTLKSGGLG